MISKTGKTLPRCFPDAKDINLMFCGRTKVMNTSLRSVIGLRDQGVWQSNGLQLVPEQSLHAFSSKRRADATQRSRELILKLQVDKIELNYKLLEAAALFMAILVGLMVRG